MFGAAVLAIRGREVGCFSEGLPHTVAHLDTSSAAIFYCFWSYSIIAILRRHNLP